MLRGIFYNSNKQKNKDKTHKIQQPCYLKKKKVSPNVWPIASAGHIRFITIITDHGNFMGVVTSMTVKLRQQGKDINAIVKVRLFTKLLKLIILYIRDSSF